MTDPTHAHKSHGIDISRQLSRRGLLVLGGLTTAAAAGGVVGPLMRSAAATTPQVNLTFESGVFGPPITTHLGATITTAAAKTGTYGCRLEPVAANNNLASVVVNNTGFALNKPWATFTMSFRCVTVPPVSDTYMNLFEIGNTSTAPVKSQFTVFFRNGRLTCDLNNTETLDIHAAPLAGYWHYIQAKVFFGATTYTAQVRYDGGPTLTLTSANDKTPQSVKVLWIHYPNVTVDYTMDIDNVKMATSDTEPDFLA